MGQSGYITLINSTDSDWTLSCQHSGQMDSWRFPEKIPKQTNQRVYVEWNQNDLQHSVVDGAEVRYSLEDNTFFEIQARVAEGNLLHVSFSNIKTHEATLQFGLPHEGSIDFILSGTSGQYTSSILHYPNWMQENIGLLGDIPLRNMCLPGTHDAGMSVRTGGTAFAVECNTLTQSNSIQGQLMLGSRYFDIRPVISSGHYYTGHYSYVSQLGAWLGANGQSMQSIIDDINTFTAQQRELVVLNLSHSLNTDVGITGYREFNQQEWDNLFRLLGGLNNLYISTDVNVDLTQLPLTQFIENKSAVVVIVENSGVLPGALQGKGFYPYRCFDAYNSYSNSNNVSTMAADQFSKMRNYMPTRYFVLSWTLTQNDTQVATCFLGTAWSIKDLANQANQQLKTLLQPEITSSNFPNIILVDNMISQEAVQMALSVNWSLHG